MNTSTNHVSIVSSCFCNLRSLSLPARLLIRRPGSIVSRPSLRTSRQCRSAFSFNDITCHQGSSALIPYIARPHVGPHQYQHRLLSYWTSYSPRLIFLQASDARAGDMDFDALRARTLRSGADEEAVTVNTRALIDKVLARYSGQWTVLRELLQNAADASATKIKIKFETIPSATVPLPADASPSSLLRHTVLHHTLKRLVVTNNGQPFTENDWNRLKRIAEGNPDETKIGALVSVSILLFQTARAHLFLRARRPWRSSGRTTRCSQDGCNCPNPRHLQTRISS